LHALKDYLIRDCFKLMLSAMLFTLCLFFAPKTAFAAGYNALDFNQTSVDVTRPVACATDSHSNYYICDAYYHQVTRLNSSFAQTGKIKDSLSLPIDIAVTDTQIYILDASTHSIQIYDTDLSFISTLGEQGLAPGQFYNPSDILINDGELYVVDNGNNRIQVFDADTLSYKRMFGLEAGNIDLDQPIAAAIYDDTIYILCKNSGSIVSANKLTGAESTAFLSLSSSDYAGLTINSSSLYLSDIANKTILEYDLDLNITNTYPTPSRTYRLSFDNNHRLLACGSTIKTDDSVIYRFSDDFSNYTVIPDIPDIGFNTPYAAIQDSDKNLYIADYGNNRIQSYTSDSAFRFSLTSHLTKPIDLAYKDGLIYALSDNQTIQIYNTSGTHIKSIDISFAANPIRLDVINSTQLVLLDKTSLFFITIDGDRINYTYKTNALATSPKDISIHNSSVYYLCSATGDLLIYNTAGVLINSVLASDWSKAPSNASSLAVTNDGVLYISDNASMQLYQYDASFNYIQTHDLSTGHSSDPYTLYSKDSLLLCFPVDNEVGLFHINTYAGTFNITLDGDQINEFSKEILSYDFTVDPGTMSIDIACDVTGDYTVSGNIGRYLLDYGLNVFTVTLNNTNDSTAYKLYVTRAYPEGFTLDNETIDAFIAYQESQTQGMPAVNKTPSSDPVQILIEFDNISPSVFEITSLSKQIKANNNDGRFLITYDSTINNLEPPQLLISAKDGVIAVSEQSISSMIKQKRNLFITLASFIGALIIASAHFFILHLQNRSPKHRFDKHIFKIKK